jgi:hypothetical protein
MFSDGCVAEALVKWTAEEPMTGISLVTVYLCHYTTRAKKQNLFDSLTELDEMYIRAKGIRAQQNLPCALVVPEVWHVRMPLRDQLNLLRRPSVTLLALQYAIRDLSAARAASKVALCRRLRDRALPLLETVICPPRFQLLNEPNSEQCSCNGKRHRGDAITSTFSACHANL